MNLLVILVVCLAAIMPVKADDSSTESTPSPTVMGDEMLAVLTWLECDPSASSTCKMWCGTTKDGSEPGSCPQHTWYCYEEAGVEGQMGCDCSIFYGCSGPKCTDYSPSVAYFMSAAALGVALLALPTIFRCARALWKVHKAGKFDWSPPQTCLVFLATSSTCGMAYNYDGWVRKFFACSDGSDDVMEFIISLCTSLFGVFFVLAAIQILLMWIDVHVKSKSMQKVAAGNSLVEVYKKALRISSVIFAVVFVACYSVSTSLAVAWSFLAGFMLFIITPIGAMNLVQMLTGADEKKGCALFCAFNRTAIPVAIFKRRSKERAEAFATADAGTTAGKFKLTRLKMAEMVEKTSIRLWFGITLYMFGGVMYIGAKAKESSYELGKVNSIHISAIILFLSIHLMDRQMLLYCTYTLRDILDADRQSSGKVSAGMSVNSSTTTAAASDEVESSDSKPADVKRMSSGNIAAVSPDV